MFCRCVAVMHARIYARCFILIKSTPEGLCRSIFYLRFKRDVRTPRWRRRQQRTPCVLAEDTNLLYVIISGENSWNIFTLKMKGTKAHIIFLSSWMNGFALTREDSEGQQEGRAAWKKSVGQTNRSACLELKTLKFVKHLSKKETFWQSCYLLT